MKFCLTVHDLTSSNLQVLDRGAEQFLKKWLGIPRHGANTAMLHMSRGLNIQTVSGVYCQAHCASYSRSRCNADELTNLALDLKLQRESAWVRKISITKQCADVHATAVMNSETLVGTKLNPLLGSPVGKTLKLDTDKYWKEVVEPLLSQGDDAKLNF